MRSYFHIVDYFPRLGGYIHNILVDVYSNLLEVSFVIVNNLQGILN